MSSDERLKKNIEPLSDADCAKCLEIEPVRYEWKDPTKPNKQVGFIAQQVREHIPELVSLLPNPEMEEVLDDSGNVLIPHKHQLVLQQSDLVPYLLGVLKVQQKRIDRLEALVERLVSRPVVAKWMAKSSPV